MFTVAPFWLLLFQSTHISLRLLLYALCLCVCGLCETCMDKFSISSHTPIILITFNDTKFCAYAYAAWAWVCICVCIYMCTQWHVYPFRFVCRFDRPLLTQDGYHPSIDRDDDGKQEFRIFRLQSFYPKYNNQVAHNVLKTTPILHEWEHRIFDFLFFRFLPFRNPRFFLLKQQTNLVVIA